MGTPSKTEVINMNPSYDLDDYKFPKIKQKDWRTVTIALNLDISQS